MIARRVGVCAHADGEAGVARYEEITSFERSMGSLRILWCYVRIRHD